MPLSVIAFKYVTPFTSYPIVIDVNNYPYGSFHVSQGDVAPIGDKGYY